MESLIESFLILARESDAGLPEEDFSVNEAVREEIERAQPLLEGKPVHLAARRTRGARCCIVAAAGFSVLIGNLIRNACQYTERGQSHGRASTRIASSCSDTGIGMSEDELRQAFQPFFRGDQQPRSGYGVGLIWCARSPTGSAGRSRWTASSASAPTATIRLPGQAQPVDHEIASDVPIIGRSLLGIAR